MPTYEYACTSCERRFDVFQRFEEDPLETCEECGGQLRRVFHPVGVLFKGSGFYSTDSRTSSKSGGGSKEPGGSKEGSATSSGAGSGSKTSGSSGSSGSTDQGAAKKEKSPPSGGSDSSGDKA